MDTKINLHFVILTILSFAPIHATNWYISPIGNDTNTGQSLESPFQTIRNGTLLAEPGDTIYLLPGTYSGTNYIVGKHGEPDLPITIKSYSRNPKEFAIIDGESEPSLTSEKAGFVLHNSSWITMENLIFHRCWVYVIQILDSHYITVRSCHFTTGKRVVHVVGHGSHHVLVEHCYIKHPDAVWKGWSWESLHHGEVSYYNGGLLHPNKSGGGHVMRRNTIINLFNAFRTRPDNITEDGNTEIYENTLTNIRDNEFEPEGWAWNMHYYRNRHVNVHKFYSIDGVKGGNIYIYGNTYTQTTDPWAIEEVSGIFKYKNGPLSYPCYAFNNSYYTEAKVLRPGESTNHLLKHFNNAYYFFQGSDRFILSEWQPGFEFDHDCINQDWPAIVYEKQQEQNGLNFSDAGFIDGLGGDFRLTKESPCLDAGMVMQLPEFEWSQSFAGDGPDIGAFEDNKPIEGPPFRFIPSPEGDWYQEQPRISRHYLSEKQLILYFTTALDTSIFRPQDLEVYQDGHLLNIEDVSFPNHPFEMVINTETHLIDSLISIQFLAKPKDTNSREVTYWASTVPIGTRPVASIPDLNIIATETTLSIDIPDFSEADIRVIPNPVKDSCKIVLTWHKALDPKYVNHLNIYSLDGNELGGSYGGEIENNEMSLDFSHVQLPAGTYIAKIRVGTSILSTKFIKL